MIMTEKEKEILDIIRQDPLIEQSEIASKLHISRSTVAVHISSLQKKGYLKGKGYIVAEDDYVLGIGASNVDVYGKSLIKIRHRYDHPAVISSSIGGVIHNIITNFAKLSGKAKVITAYSDDIYGKAILDDYQKHNIDVSDSLLVKDSSSGVFMQIQDDDNDMYMAICDMSVLKNITPQFLNEKIPLITNAKMVVIDPSLNDETITRLIEICKDKVPIYADTLSDEYAIKLRPYVSGFELIKPNKSELENLTGMKIKSDDDIEKAALSLIDKGTKKVFVSLGKEGILYMDKDTKIRRKFKEEKDVVNASGAGDALMGTIIYGELNRLPIEETIDLGLAAGIAAIRCQATINENMSLELLNKIIKEKK